MYLELRDVWKRYPKQEKAAVRGITLEIRSERITALAGESGSGKTTLLRLIAGFERPDRGVVRHNDHDDRRSGHGQRYDRACRNTATDEHDHHDREEFANHRHQAISSRSLK